MNRQKLSSSLTKSTVKNIKQSRLSNNNNIKQNEIRKKLSKISSIDELQKIHIMLTNQNKQLIKDLTILKQHLSKIEQTKRQKHKQKINSTSKLLMKNNINNMMNSLTQSKLSSSNVHVISQQQLKKYPKQLVVEYQQLRKQLHQQYKLMGLLKGNITNLQRQFPTEEVADQKLNQNNRLKQLSTQIQTQSKKKSLLLKQNQKLQQTINKQINSPNPNQQQITKLQIQNKQLKKQILLFKQQTYKHQVKAAKIIDSIYQKKQLLTQYSNKNSLKEKKCKEQDTKREKIIVQIDSKNKRSNSVSNIRVISNNSDNKILGNKTKHISAVSVISNYNTIENINKSTTPFIQNNNYNQQQQQSNFITTTTTQITQLKNQINQISLASIKAKQLIKKQKQTIKHNNIKLNQNFILLDKIKTKKISQLNHLKATLKNIIKQIQVKQAQKIKMVNTTVQQSQYCFYSNMNQNNNNKLLFSLLRRDFAGIIGPKNRFDDRVFLKQKTKSFIKGLIVYENDNNLSIKGSIAAIRAIYTDQQTNQMNHVPLPGAYLQKCKTQRLQLPQDDFLKLLKVKYNTKQTRVTKIQIRSNRNLRYEFGQKRPFQQIGQHEIVYAFDIGLDEFPVAMFGSYCMIKNCWYLQSIGVQINTLT